MLLINGTMHTQEMKIMYQSFNGVISILIMLNFFICLSGCNKKPEGNDKEVVGQTSVATLESIDQAFKQSRGIFNYRELLELTNILTEWSEEEASQKVLDWTSADMGLRIMPYDASHIPDVKNVIFSIDASEFNSMTIPQLELQEVKVMEINLKDDKTYIIYRWKEGGYVRRDNIRK